MALGTLSAATAGQRDAIRGATAALVFVALWIVFAYTLWPAEPVFGTTASDRIAQALSWQAVAFLPVLVATGVLAWQRFQLTALNPLAPAPPGLAFATWYVQSSARHSTLLLVGHVAFSLVAPPVALPLVPFLVVAFVVGRTTLWVGGPGRADAMAFAFTTSIVPTSILTLYAAWIVMTNYAVILGLIPYI